MMRRIGEMRYISEKFIEFRMAEIITSLKSKNDLEGLDGLSKNIEGFFKYKTSALRDWSRDLWVLFLGLIIYCLIMMFATGTQFKGGLDPDFLFFAILWASINLYLFYRMMDVHFTEIAEPTVVKKV